MVKTTSKNPLQVLVEPITRSRVKKFKNAFNEIIQSIWAKMNFNKITTSTSDDQTLVNLVYVQEGPDLSTI